ncbi:MAG: hypothetical protein NZ108_10115, partial [Bacteroidia bacterium]|nr:hypothetical protein [Bacteroidia bacterium]
MKFLVQFLLLVSVSVAQRFPSLVSQKFYGTKGDDLPKKILKSPDDGILLAGAIASDKDSASARAWITKLTPEGNQLWSRQIYSYGKSEIRDMTISPYDTTILFCGTTNVNLSHQEKNDVPFRCDYFVGKIKLDGTILWVKQFGGSDQDIANGIAPTNYGGCFVIGSSWSQDYDVSGNAQGRNNSWLIILDKDGNLIRENS